MESFQIYLDSKDALNLNDTYIFYLPNLEIQDGYYLYLQLQNCSIPYSFYNINNNTNYFNYLDDGQLYNVTLTNGNYNINQLVTELKNKIGQNFTITYNNITNKITFSHNKDFTFIYSKLLDILGFTMNNLSSVNKSLTSTNCINLNYIRCINLVSNISTYNINKSLENNSVILCNIPVNNSPYSIIYYQNYNGFRTNLYTNKLDYITIKLTDNYENNIDLNGLNFNLTIQIDVESFRK